MHRVDTIISHVGHRRYCHLERSGDVAILILHHKPFNSLVMNMRAAVEHYFREAVNDPAVRCIVITAEGGVFSCGVNIKDFKDSATRGNDNGSVIPNLMMLTNMIEASSKVVIAAINGLAFSGGLELALAAHYRVALPSSEFLFPEVQLGIVPCGGGTQRLPRLVGVYAAFCMMCTSKRVRAGEALAMGLVDHLASDTGTHMAMGGGNAGGDKSGVHPLGSYSSVVAEAIRLSTGWKEPRRVSRDSSRLGSFVYNRMLFRWMERQIRLKTPKEVRAPMRCLRAIQAATTHLSFEAGLETEMKLFLEALGSPEAEAMQYLLRASNAVSFGRFASLPQDARDGLTIRRLAVIGCGTIGSGVTHLALCAGLFVIVVENSDELCRKASCRVQADMNRSVEEGRISQELCTRYLANVTFTTCDSDLVHALKDVDLVIECAGESLNTKKQIFARLDAVCSPHCSIATSASSLSIGELATATRRPEKVIGMHFIPPSDVIPFLEIVQGPLTDQTTLLRAVHLGQLFHKAVIITKDIGACVTTRLLSAGLYQAFAMLEQGSFPVEVDRALRRFGFRLGVFALEDLAGLEFTARIRTALKRHGKSSHPEADVYTIPRLLVRSGRLGERAGRGWHSYETESPLGSVLRRVRRGGEEEGVPAWGVWRKGGASLRRTPHPDRAVELLILDVCRKKNILRRDISEKEIVERIVFACINEAAKLLGEGAVSSCAAIDVAMAFGYGFPAWRGGVCYYADKFGLSNVVHRMRIYNHAFGDAVFPPPCDELVEMAALQQTFRSMWF